MQIDDVSPALDSFTPSLSRSSQCASGKTLCAALSPDGLRAYVGGHSGVWRSDDGGATWWHPEWRPATTGGPTPPGALLSPNVYDLVVQTTDSDTVFAAASDDVREPPSDGVYRSTDGARNWSLVHRFAGNAFVGCLAAAPDDPKLLFAAGTTAVAFTTDGGDAWIEKVPSPGAAVYHVVCGPAGPSGRRVYAAGNRFWFSNDGGVTWQIDPGGPALAQVGAAATASARSLAIHPHNDLIVYAMKSDLTLWIGVYTSPTSPAVWAQLPSPPIAGGTASGGSFVLAHAISSGEVFLYVSDRRSVHATIADPGSADAYTWVDQGEHVDPHGLALTPDFHPWAPDFDPPTWGRALLVNDGGTAISTSGMQTWDQTRGLSTLNSANVAVNTVPGGPTAITFAGGDNSGFSSPDDGVTWRTQDYLGGDNDCAFADPRQPTRMLVFAPRSGSPVSGEIYLYVSPDANPPDTSVGTSQRQRIPSPTTVNAAGNTVRAWNAVSSYVNFGYRPLILTRRGEKPLPDGDFVTIRWPGVPEASQPVLLRTTALSSITAATDWDVPGALVTQVGDALPGNTIGVVQPSGGHGSPTFYVSDVNSSGASVYRLAPGTGTWQAIVPHQGGGIGPAVARRFFVDPYRPEHVYVLADDSVYRSDDGGGSWVVDTGLDRAITENGAFPRTNLSSPNPAESVLRDMQFDPVYPGFRLAIGIAGVFVTQDGDSWSPLLRSSAVALQPTSMIFDPMGCERTLYIGTMGRGVLRLRPLPPDWDFPVGSLQGARGRITLLRVHDVGTGYGPPYDRIDGEVVIWLDTQPGKTFGLQLRADPHGPAAGGMVDLLRDSFNSDRPVRIDFIRTGCRTGKIIRVMEA